MAGPVGPLKTDTTPVPVKKVSFLLVAVEAVEPQVPAACWTAPKNRVATVSVAPEGSTLPPLITSFPVFGMASPSTTATISPEDAQAAQQALARGVEQWTRGERGSARTSFLLATKKDDTLGPAPTADSRFVDSRTG